MKALTELEDVMKAADERVHTLLRAEMERRAKADAEIADARQAAFTAASAWQAAARAELAERDR